MSELCPAGRSEGYAIRDAEDPPANFLQQRLEPERSGAPFGSSCPGRLDFGPAAAAARMRGQSLSLPRLTASQRPPELGPRKFRGSGGGATMGGDAHRSPPPAAFCLLCRRGQRRSPRRAKPCKVRRAESSRPTGVMIHGGRANLGAAPTTSQANHSRRGMREGQAPPLRGGGEAFCAGGCAKNTRPRRPFGKKGMAGLNYHKMYDNVPLLTSARHGWRCFLWQAITQSIFLSTNGSRTIR